MSNLSASVVLEKNRLFTEFKGGLTENIVIQLLHNAGFKQLFYWTLENKAKVDLILQINQDIIPLEIKAGHATKKKSLQLYAKKYAPIINYRASLLNLKHENTLVNYPLYMLEKFPLPLH